MIGVIFATKWEARPFLETSRAELAVSHPFALYSIPDNAALKVVVSGIGKVAAATACQYMIHVLQATRIVNAGACGLLSDNPTYGVGQLVRVSEAMEGDHEVFGKRPKPVVCSDILHLELATGRLVTCDRPVFDFQKRHACAKLGELVDMEGAAIARVAELFSVPCELVKGVTDRAQPTDRETLMENLRAVSEHIAEMLWPALEQKAYADKNSSIHKN